MSKTFLKRLTIQFLLTSISIFLISSLPYLFFNIKAQIDILKMIEMKTLDNTLFLYDTIMLNFQEYFSHIFTNFKQIVTGQVTDYYARGREFPLFPEMRELFAKSMAYLVIGILLGLLLAVFSTLFIMSLSYKFRALPKMILFILESLPDIFIILVFQLFVIWTYKNTGLLAFNIVSGFNQEPPFILPIIILSLLPAIYMTKHLLLSFEHEEKMLYVQFAYSKGLNKWSVLLTHIFRNSVLSFFYHFKSIFTFALANLLMLEIIFDIDGFMTFIFEHSVLNPEILTISLFLFFIPFFIIFSSCKWALESRYSQGGENA